MRVLWYILGRIAQVRAARAFEVYAAEIMGRGDVDRARQRALRLARAREKFFRRAGLGPRGEVPR